MKIKVLIVDDESHSRSFLRKLLNSLFEDKIIVVDECDGLKTAIPSIVKYSPDIVFLDIQMPEEIGFELFNYFEKINFEIIFTTAHIDFAIDAIRASAFDYLLKPININELEEAIARFELKVVQEKEVDRYRLLIENLNTKFTENQKIVISTKKGFEVISLNSLIYCEADQSYSKFITQDKTIESSKSLKDANEILVEPTFLKVHKSFIVNKNYVISFSSSEYVLKMSSGKLIPVSDKLFTKKQLIDAFKK
ncbi:two-component system LytT family response regulator [Flavobacterium arsenatis]|uniref:Two-component system LytT family response regulator n=1 Tax=Flavobacterium arsenatis TaxID=1484332 RepID=A0ABU1TNN3_9FLAO|nr:LytTR family DNA-binding domain-containing protein [Flavobacterium arsenatis]MDR6967579.1 two-component system LytT family response regulator [Flavobacterium arsenatis]